MVLGDQYIMGQYFIPTRPSMYVKSRPWPWTQTLDISFLFFHIYFDKFYIIERVGLHAKCIILYSDFKKFVYNCVRSRVCYAFCGFPQIPSNLYINHAPCIWLLLLKGILNLYTYMTFTGILTFKSLKCLCYSESPVGCHTKL
jgi:hypothetical protein